MKPLNKTELDVQIFDNSYNKWYWVAYCDDNTGVSQIHGGIGYETKNLALSAFNMFAHANNINKYKIKDKSRGFV